MLKSKTMNRLLCISFAVMLALTAVVWVGKSAAGRQSTVTVGYEGLFDQSTVHTINIEMADWDAFIASATQETYTECSVTIDGEKISGAGIRAKGNTSLSSVASMGSKKYSFKIEFDQFVKGRSYRGLDKLSLNNLIYDATLMKDYLAYTLMNRAGVPAPLCSYAQITVNGEPWGLYLAVEGVEDGFLERNSMTTGELYKPDSMSFGGGRGNGRDFDFEQFRVREEENGSAEGTEQSNESADQGNAAPAAREEGDAFADSLGSSFGGQASSDGSDSFGGSFGGQASSGGFPGQLPVGFTLPEGFTPPEGTDGEGQNGNFRMGSGMFNFGMGNSDVKLQYIDDDPDSYANIFNNAKTKISKKDQTRLIKALKTLSGDHPRDAVFSDEVIRYLAVHDFLQNDDSYTGMMVHNYYLYEEQGRLAIIPWDYNLAFGGMGGGSDAASTVNSPIDSPVSSGTAADRPLVSWILEDEEALEQYHEVYSQFIADTVESGWLREEISRVAALIRPYVEADENGFFSAEEFDEGIAAMQSYCALRGESIRGQLSGLIPSTSEGQRKDASALVDAGSLNMSAMGAMNNGFGRNNAGASFTLPGVFTRPGADQNDSQTPADAQPTAEIAGGSPTPGQQTPGPNGADSSFCGQAPNGNENGQGMNGSFGGQAPSGNENGQDFAGSFGGQAPGAAGTAQPAAQSTLGPAPAESQTPAPADDNAAADPAGSSRPSGRTRPDGERTMPAGGFPGGPEASSGVSGSAWITLGVCLAVLLAALLLAARIKGHNG